jgi:tetratricopeptide (TPR) repeat protein
MYDSLQTRAGDDDPIPVPAELPPMEGLDDEDQYAPGRRPRTWLWTLVAALILVLLVVTILMLGVLGFYDGLKDRARASRQFAQDHYALGVERLETGDYELAIAEFQLAMRYDSGLRDAEIRLLEAKELARAQVPPTSEARRDATASLYRQAVTHYESGELAQAVAVLDELRGLDADHQRDNVETMLGTAHHQLGLDAVREDQLDDARVHFEAVLAYQAGTATGEQSQEQLNLLNLYVAALNHWERDWSATIQALNGLFALAPGYKDVQLRLHDAYTYRAQELVDEGDWCRASDEYAAAVNIFPLESTVDKRDDASIRCQGIDQVAVPVPTARPTAKPSASPLSLSDVAPTPTAETVDLGSGQIAFTSFDPVRRMLDIYVVDLSQGAARLLRENASQPAFAPDGSQIAFRNLNPEHLGLGVLDLGTDRVNETTAHPEDSTPVWSPDKSQLVFASDKEGDRRWRMYVISPAEVRGEGQEWTYGRMPAWSADGDRIVYHGCNERGNDCGLWVMRPGGFDSAHISTDGSDTSPSWSPDGSRVVFISTRDGNWELYVVDVASGVELRLTDDPATDVAPVWSPDGRRLAFLSDRGGAWAVYVLDIASDQVRKVIATGDVYPDPVSERMSWVR